LLALFLKPKTLKELIFPALNYTRVQRTSLNKDETDTAVDYLRKRNGQTRTTGGHSLEKHYGHCGAL